MTDVYSKTVPPLPAAKLARPSVWLEDTIIKLITRLKFGHLTVQFPSGRRESVHGAKKGPQAILEIHNLRFLWRLLISGDIGFAESYMSGEWSTPDLSALLTSASLNEEAFGDSVQGSWIAKSVSRLRHARRANTRKGSRRNIAAHYDLGNDFYRLWLDESMTYSAALFSKKDVSLSEAQQQKYLRIATDLNLKAGQSVLEIGCGWGGFAEFAAKELGCSIVCLTLSREQALYATERLEKAGLSDKVEVRLQDYRDVTGKFDAIVSIEMFEAVGEKNWIRYFETVKGLLKEDGKAVVQTITICEGQFDFYRQNPDFIQRYIFPGGMLPSKSAFAQSAENAGLAVSGEFDFGKSYAQTLRIWRRDFERRWDDIERLGFDQRFYLMWRYYLCYCEIGFDRGITDVRQFVIHHR